MALPLLAAGIAPAYAQNSIQDMLSGAAMSLGALDRGALIAFALFVGVIAFATTTAIVHVRYRMGAARREAATLSEIARLEAQIEEGRALLLAEPQIIVVWRDPGADPEIIGNTAAFTGVVAPSRLLAFGAWLAPSSAREADEAVDRLRRRGAALSLALVTHDGRACRGGGPPGRQRRGAAAARSDRRARRSRPAHRGASPAGGGFRGTADTSGGVARPGLGALQRRPPRLGQRRLCPCGGGARCRGCRRPVAEPARRADAAGGGARRRRPARPSRSACRWWSPASGACSTCWRSPSAAATAGIALDATETEAVRAELAAVIGAHRRTLDHLSTAVAIFDRDRRLAFHNAAYARLFELDPAFLDDRPTDGAVLDRLRAARRLPEQADFRAWREELHEAYRAIEPREHWWHLPGGRTLRVVTAPNPEGGVTYLADEVTERLALESRYNALTRIRSETLDALAEAVAVFHSDGRLDLFNSAFLELWRLQPAALKERPHIDAVVALCRPLGADPQLWTTLRAAVTTIEERRPGTFRMERTDGTILDGSTQPLPDGGTLVTFRNVTDTVHVERVLVERNEALVAADHLKSTFVSHVSYELRSPLTTIIGFAQLLDDSGIGPLNEKQRAYVSHITESSAALLAIINDILDLATIDAGAMTLDLAEVDARAAMEGAAEGVRDRLAEGGVKLAINGAAGLGQLPGGRQAGAADPL